jgi:hypothetical protein
MGNAARRIRITSLVVFILSLPIWLLCLMFAGFAADDPSGIGVTTNTILVTLLLYPAYSSLGLSLAFNKQNNYWLLIWAIPFLFFVGLIFYIFYFT